MDKKTLLKGLKGYRTHSYSIKTISDVVPHLIADLFKTFFVIDEKRSQPVQLGYDWGRLMEFQVNLGSMISEGRFDYLDNVVLQFLNGFGCVIAPYKVSIKFSQESIDKYCTICNNFKNQEWDDIIDEFIDATYDLFSSGKILEKNIIKE